MTNKSFNILQWNCRGIKSNTEFKNFIFNYPKEIDIICLQETFLKSKHTYKLPGYNVVRRDRPDTIIQGGIMTLIKKGIDYVEKPHIQELESLTVEIVNSQLYITNIYISPTKKVTSESIKALFESNNKSIITGDLNGHSTLWGMKKSNEVGKQIEIAIQESDYVVINIGEPTFQINHGGMSALDVTIVNPNLAGRCSWNVTEDLLGSDHLPTITTITNRKDITCEISYEKFFNLKKAD